MTLNCFSGIASKLFHTLLGFFVAAHGLNLTKRTLEQSAILRLLIGRKIVHGHQMISESLESGEPAAQSEGSESLRVTMCKFL